MMRDPDKLALAVACVVVFAATFAAVIWWATP
jgi:hypothetical protein